MKISSYIKDKLYLVFFALIIWFIMVLFLNAVRCNVQIIVMISVLFWFLIVTILLVEFMRRRVFYRKLMDLMEHLDQKYLVCEIIEEPEFMDGAILYSVMQEVNKNMLEHVNEYRRREADYRNYIEMWVHEIKTPLAAVKLIMHNHQNEVTESIAEEMERVENFVEQALFYARSTTLEKDYIIKEMPLQPTVNKIIRKHSKEFIYRKIKLETDGLEEHVYSDAKWLEFILHQIISNALKYSEDESSIRIYTKKGKEHITLYIEDHGIGISMADLPRVFDKGFTGKNGRKNEKATGMGLYLCKMLCDKLYLDLHMASQEGIGTTVRIVFPISTMMLLK